MAGILSMTMHQIVAKDYGGSKKKIVLLLKLFGRALWIG